MLFGDRARTMNATSRPPALRNAVLIDYQDYY